MTNNPPPFDPQRLQPRSVVISEKIDYDNARLLPEKTVEKGVEYVTVRRPVDYVTSHKEIPIVQHVETLVPKIQVREVLKEIPSTKNTYVDETQEVPHIHYMDKYIEVPEYNGIEYTYVPKVEVQERVIKTTKPEIKWVEEYVEVPQVKEVVRYVESDSNIEKVIRYVPKSSNQETVVQRAYAEPIDQELVPGDYIVGPAGANYTPKNVAVTGRVRKDAGLFEPPSPRLDRYEQVFVPKVVKTVEVKKEVPVTVDVPVPFMVPKPIQIPVEVPTIKFRDHFVPVPIRRKVIPKVMYTDEVYEVECIIEKPVLMVEDVFKPATADVEIEVREKDIMVLPLNPADLSQADFHSMWNRVNADLLEQYEDKFGRPPAGLVTREDETQPPQDENINEKLDYGPIPMHPGHPLMMTWLQNQWINQPSTATHEMYTPEFFRLHASALNSILDPQPHQVNLTEEQAIAFGPLPQEVLVTPWDAEVQRVEEKANE